ncbi:MAG: Rv3654c family TadE-like protein [Arachnia sp.]
MRSRDERGSGTLLTAGVCVCLLAVAWASSLVVAWLVQISSVQDSADLAALAASAAHAQQLDGCAAAEAAAARNESEMIECTINGDEWSFVVEVHVSQALHPALPGGPPLIERMASAGSIP